MPDALRGQAQRDFAFFQDAVACVSGKLEISHTLPEIFCFLQAHFPLEALVFQQYSNRLRSLKLLCLVQPGRFDFVELTVPMSEDDAKRVASQEQQNNIVHIPSCFQSKVGEMQGRAMNHLLPFRERAMLIGMLHTGERMAGHLCMLGTGPRVFTLEHERKLAFLLTPFTLTLDQMRHARRIADFQTRLHEQDTPPGGRFQPSHEPDIIGENGGLMNVMRSVRRMKGRDTTVLILGETGTGKELIADVIQRISPRRDGPFIRVNCGAIPETLVDSELFGYQKGAFTGATTSRAGRFEQADNGTLFLDEVGELPLSAQVRLLRVLQDRVVERLGGGAPRTVNVRIIAATNRNLEAMLQQGLFREDLYYRLHVFPVHVPPLRERAEDIAPLAHHFVRRASARLGLKSPPPISPRSLEMLRRHSWPGNVRELENLVERTIILSPNRPLELDELLSKEPGWYLPADGKVDDLERFIDARIREFWRGESTARPLEASRGREESACPPPPPPPPRAPHFLDSVQREAILVALRESGGKVNGPGGAAELLGMNPSTLRNRMRRLGISFGRGGFGLHTPEGPKPEGVE